MDNKEDWLVLQNAMNLSWQGPSYEGLDIKDFPDNYNYVVWKKEG